MNEIVEKLSAFVHDAWWDEKKKQGFHAPVECPAFPAVAVIGSDFDKFAKICDKCHSDMYPYEELPENIKEYDRVMVRTVLRALGKCGGE